MMSLTAFDIVVGLLVVIAAFAGLARGFVGEVVTLLAWVAGIAAVRFLYTPGKAIATGLVGTESGGAILALVVIFLTAFIVVRVLGGKLADGARSSIIGPVDRLLGLGFGAAKGVLAAALLFLLANMAFDTIDPGEPAPEWMTNSRTAPTLAMVSKALVDFVGEQRRVAPDTADAGDPHKGLERPASGYDKDDRGALDRLLDAAEKSTPSTPI